jgi:hypothetical protein
MATHPGDVLSAASLLAAIVGLLYSLWYPEMREALAAERMLHRQDREPSIAVVREAIRTKALPLFLASSVQVLIFGPDALTAIRKIIKLTSPPGQPVSVEYDSVQAAFVVVYIVSVLLATLALAMLWRLRQKLNSLQRL